MASANLSDITLAFEALLPTIGEPTEERREQQRALLDDVINSMGVPAELLDNTLRLRPAPNPSPQFFDVSRVFAPADRVASQHAEKWDEWEIDNLSDLLLEEA